MYFLDVPPDGIIQRAMVLEGLAIAPYRALAPAALACLPLPEEVWDAL